MNQKHSLLFFVATLLLTLAACIGDDVADSRSLIGEGDSLPAFTIELSDGRTLTTADLAGAPTVIVLFTTHCPDCRRELPVLQQLHQLRPQLEIVCIAREQSADEIEKYWQENGLTLVYSPQPDRKVYNLFATESVPRIYIADSRCIVTAAFDDTDMPSLELLLQLTDNQP